MGEWWGGRGCWETDPVQRPSAGDLYKIIENWYWEIKGEKDTEFYQQYKKIEQIYSLWSQNTPYKIHPAAVTTSKLINTKEITEQLRGGSRDLDLELNLIEKHLENIEIKDSPQEQSSTQAHIQIPPK